MASRAEAHILIVDDDIKVRRMLRRYLEDEGFAVSEAANAVDVRKLMPSQPDLVTLDLNLGGADGLSIAREIRQVSDIPIIIITGKGEVFDRVVGLEVGADDYIAKPFHLREVLARVRSVLRRSHASEHLASNNNEEKILSFNDFQFDVERRTLVGPDGPIELTSGEFDLLSIFARSPHRVLDRDQIMDKLKGHQWAPLDRSIDNQIARLRKKIESDPRHPVLLKTVRGAGYMFTPGRGSSRP